MNGKQNIVSAACYLFAPNENNQMCILCGRRSGNDIRHKGGLFDVPVGMIEQGETPIQTAIRELQEEAGITLSTNLLEFYDYQSWGNGSPNAGSNFYAVLDGCIKIGNGDFEHDFFTWLPIKEISNYKWAFGMDKKIMEIYTSFTVDKELNEFFEHNTFLIN